MTSTKIVFL